MDGFVARWWRQSGQFEWLSRYLYARGLAVPTRRLMVVFCAALVPMPLGLVGPPSNVVSIVLLIASVTVGVGFAVVYVRGWPTRRQSLALVVSGGLIFVACILVADPVKSLVACSGLVVLGVYLAIFHSVKAVAVSMAVSVVLAAVCAIRVVEAGVSSQIAISGFWVIVEVSAGVPLAVQALVRTLGADVVRSDQDALTGVLNRRAFYERARTLLTTPGGDRHLIVIMIDLDKFKLINDTFGHPAGDQVLTAVGWALRQSNSTTAIIGRAGGEEFLVTDAVYCAEAERLPARLCEAISALPHAITASVGAAVVPLEAAARQRLTIDKLVHIADAAMYSAKRSGGNRAVIQTMSTV
ncbi:GGDEF domain-containing protein [Mycolicibacterium iranicum]|uniref:GGDEF domain-containing protein n=1 Tax=Mycolicibacterium iranicum TaxID=912594 RepID=UPI000AF5DE9C|nr:GGDEF domain-containing protein [Mycolicibacterium iranicum]